jgi:hypothetical protein
MAKLNLNELVPIKSGLAENEALKELGRVALIAAIPVLIDSLQKGNVDWRTILVVAVVAVLRAVDRYLHKLDSENPVTSFLRFEK